MNAFYQEIFYQEAQTIYFLEIDRTYHSGKDSYDAENRTLTVNAFPYNEQTLRKGAMHMFTTSSTYNNNRYYTSRHLYAVNFYEFYDQFTSLEYVQISMSPEEAKENREHIGVRIGIQFKYNPNNPERLAYRPLFHPGDEFKGIDYILVAHLKSITVYNKITNEIFKQINLFDDASPVWNFPLEEENNEDNEDDKEDDDNDNGSSSSSGGCFINTVF